MIKDVTLPYRYVTIDIDIFFDDFIKDVANASSTERPNITIKHVRDGIRELKALPHLKDIMAGVKGEYQRSPRGNVHIRLTFQQDITLLFGFLVRAWFADDLKRLRLDEMRYLKTLSPWDMNRCFSEKSVDDKCYSAGPWIPIGTDISDLQDNDPAYMDYRAFIAVRNKNESQARLAI